MPKVNVIVDLSMESTLEDSIDDGDQCLHDKVLVTLDGNPFRESHTTTLGDTHGWLTDEIINCFSARLKAKYANVLHICSTYFFEKLRTSVDDNLWLQRWVHKYSLPKKHLFIPVNWNNSHWAIAHVYFEKEDDFMDTGETRKSTFSTATIRYYDSMMSNGHAKVALNLVKKCLENSKLVTIRDAHEHHSVKVEKKTENVGLLAFMMSKIKIDNVKTLPLKKDSKTKSSVIISKVPNDQQQQMDGSSCGVFVCWRMAQIIANYDGDRDSVERVCNPHKYRRNIERIIIENKF